MKKINTFIIPILNNYEGALKLVKSIKKYTPDNYYIFIINNGFPYENIESLNTIKKLKEESHLWIDPYRNLGFGKAMNIGIKLAQTEFVTLSNDDVEILYPEWWEEIMIKFRLEPKLGGFNPHSFVNKNAQGDRVIQYDIKDNYTKDDILKMKEIFKNEREYIGGCTFFTICRRRMFDDVGLFDESFGQGSGEDYDLDIRAARKNWIIKGGSSTMVLHWWGKTKDNMPKGIGISNYDLIAAGNQNMERKWGKHIDKDPNGWSVSGKGGPQEPLDKDKVNYKDNKWYQEVDL